MAREIFEIVCIAVVTNFITWQVSWRLGVKNGRKWQKYRQQADIKAKTTKGRIQ